MLSNAATLPASGPGTYHHHDALGNVVALTNAASCAVLETYTYDPFGKRTVYNATGQQIPDSAYANTHGYTGREHLPLSGLMDYRNRSYSTTLGRFLQTDPIRFDAGDVNLYRYVFNSSVMFIDPSGSRPPNTVNNLPTSTSPPVTPKPIPTPRPNNPPTPSPTPNPHPTPSPTPRPPRPPGPLPTPTPGPSDKECCEKKGGKWLPRYMCHSSSCFDDGVPGGMSPTEIGTMIGGSIGAAAGAIKGGPVGGAVGGFVGGVVGSEIGAAYCRDEICCQ